MYGIEMYISYPVLCEVPPKLIDLEQQHIISQFL